MAVPYFEREKHTFPTPDGAVTDFAGTWVSDYSKTARGIHGELVVEGRLQLLTTVIPGGGTVTQSWLGSWAVPVPGEYRQRQNVSLEHPVTRSCWALKFCTLLDFLGHVHSWFLILKPAVMESRQMPTRFRRIGLAKFMSSWEGCISGERRTIRLV